MHADGAPNWLTRVYPNKKDYVELVSEGARAGLTMNDLTGERICIARLDFKVYSHSKMK